MADRILTSAVKRVDNGVYQAIQSIVSGSPQSGILRLNAAGCGVGYAPFHQAAEQISAEDETLLVAIWRALAAGTLHTGASGAEGDQPPTSLASGALPDVPKDAPQPSDCQVK